MPVRKVKEKKKPVSAEPVPAPASPPASPPALTDVQIIGTPDARITAERKVEFEAYGLFMALGYDQRKEVFGLDKGTDAEFAAKFSVTPQTLVRWKADPILWKIRDKYIGQLKQFTAPMLRAFAHRATLNGSAHDVETWMRIVEGYVPRQEADVKHEGLADFIEAEIRDDETPSAHPPGS